MTADDDDIDDASLKSMRAVWLSMRDEDPPSAGMSGLLAAAREQADAMRARPTWWHRIVTQLRRPPALAFATVMLLVGGAVLVTRNVDQKVESETAAMAPADELRYRESTPEPEERAAPLDEPARPLPPAVPEQEKASPNPRPKKDLGGKAKRPRAGATTADEVGPHEPSRHDRFDGDTKRDFAEGRESKPTVLESPGRVEPAPTPQPPPKETRLTDSSTVTTPPSEQLARQAESAATRGDCPAVREIVGKLKRQDERFYKARLANNAAVTKCL